MSDMICHDAAITAGPSATDRTSELELAELSQLPAFPPTRQNNKASPVHRGLVFLVKGFPLSLRLDNRFMASNHVLPKTHL
jgi:hypothetical protein